ncbi:MAG: DUF4270 family protein [Verrucomicrobia bacterium]|nr:DUF4270 family protein [Cytophagales bacterium]
MNCSVVKTVLSVIFFTFIFYACQQDPKEIGLGFADPNSGQVVFSDTFSLKTSTLYIDSAVSANVGRLLVGQYEDPKFGKITAHAFVEPSLFSFTFGNFPVYDSVALILDYDYSYGDSTHIQHLSVYKLSEKIDTLSYKTSDRKLAYEASPLGSVAFRANKFRPAGTRGTSITFPSISVSQSPVPVFTQGSNDTLRISLNNDFGRDLFNQSRAGVFTSDDLLRQYLKGFALIPDVTDNAAICGFSALNSGGFSSLRLYYHASGSTTPLAYDFRISFKHFSTLQANRSSTALSNLQAYQPLPSALTNEETYLQAGTAIVTKLEFTNLEFLKSQKNISINSAELLLTPIVNNTTFTPPPPDLVLYEATANNRFRLVQNTVSGIQINSFVTVQGEGTGQVINIQSPQIAGYDALNNRYRFFITSYFQAAIISKNPNNSLLIAPAYQQSIAPLGASTDRLILGSPKHPTAPVRFKVYYTKLNP